MKKDWKTNLALPDASIRQVMQIIDSGGRQIAFVVDGSGRLLGSVTDGDIRRALLRGQGLDAPVTTAMNQNPVIKTPDSDRRNCVGWLKSAAHVKSLLLTGI